MIYSEPNTNTMRMRAAERADLPRFVTWLNDPEVIEFLLIHLPMSLASEEAWFEAMLKRPQAEQILVMEIPEQEQWKPIGNVSLMDIDWKNRSAEVGIVIGEKTCWGMGYGRTAMRMMLRHGFETLNLNRIWLRVFEHNLRGIKSYERAGFQPEGRLRQAQYQDGRYYDLLVMSVLREEWKK